MGYPAVEYGEFARQTINLRNLSDLYRRVADIEKRLSDTDRS
jgi:hypothetical protein